MDYSTFNASNSHIFESALRISLIKLEEFQNCKTRKNVRIIILTNNVSNYICKLLDDLILQENPSYIPKKLTAPVIDHFEIQSKLKHSSNERAEMIQQAHNYTNIGDPTLSPKLIRESKYTPTINHSKNLKPITGCYIPDLFGRSDSVDYLNITNSQIFLPAKAKTTIKDYTVKILAKKNHKKWNWNLFKRTKKEGVDNYFSQSQSYSQSSITSNWSPFDHTKVPGHVDIVSDISWESKHNVPSLDLDKRLISLSTDPSSVSIDAFLGSNNSVGLPSSNSTSSKSASNSAVDAYSIANTKLSVNSQSADASSLSSKESLYNTNTLTSPPYRSVNLIHNSLENLHIPENISNEINNSKRKSTISNLSTSTVIGKSLQAQSDQEFGKISVSNFLTNISVTKKTNRYSKSTKNGFENLRLMRENLRSKQTVKSIEPLEVMDDKMLKEVVDLKKIKRKSSRLSISMVLDQEFLKTFQDSEPFELEREENQFVLDDSKVFVKPMDNISSEEVILSIELNKPARNIQRKDKSTNSFYDISSTGTEKSKIILDPTSAEVRNKSAITESKPESALLDCQISESMPSFPKTSTYKKTDINTRKKPSIFAEVVLEKDFVNSPGLFGSDLATIPLPLEGKECAVSFKEEENIGFVSGISRMVQSFELLSNQNERNFSNVKGKRFETPTPVTLNENPGERSPRLTKPSESTLISNEFSTDVYKGTLAMNQEKFNSPNSKETDKVSITQEYGIKKREGIVLLQKQIETQAVKNEYSKSPIHFQNGNINFIKDVNHEGNLISSLVRKPVPAHIKVKDKASPYLATALKKSSSELNEIQNMIRRFELAKSANPGEIIIPERSTSRQSNESSKPLLHVESGSLFIPERTASASSCWTCKSKTLTCPKHGIKQNVIELRRKTFRDHNMVKKQIHTAFDESNPKGVNLSSNTSDIYNPPNVTSSNHFLYHYSKNKRDIDQKEG